MLTPQSGQDDPLEVAHAYSDGNCVVCRPLLFSYNHVYVWVCP